MSDDLRERVAAAMWNSRGNGDWNDATNTALIAIYRNLADAALAEMDGAREAARDEGSEMKLAYDAYRKCQRDALDGIRVADPRVILSRVRAIAEGKE